MLSGKEFFAGEAIQKGVEMLEMVEGIFKI